MVGVESLNRRWRYRSARSSSSSCPYLHLQASLSSGAPQPTRRSRAGKVYRIGFLRAGQPPKAWIEAFHQGLRERGYVEGQNVVVEFRVTDGSVDQLQRLAEELVRSRVA